MRKTSVATTLVLLVLTACAEQTIEGASSFAKSATALQDSLNPLLDESFRAQLRRNSQELINLRPTIPSEKDRLDQLKKEEALMAATFQTTAYIKEQIDLLKSVFVALGTLAESDADNKISEATTSLIDELDAVSKKAVELELLKNSLFAGQKDAIANIIAKGATLAVAQFKAAAIREFLEDNGETILESLEIQEQLLDVVSERLKFYGRADLADLYFKEVAVPYVEGPAPNRDSWANARLNHYAAKVNLERVGAAKTGSRNVKLAFVALSENRLTLDSISLIVADIARIQGFISAVRSAANQ